MGQGFRALAAPGSQHQRGGTQMPGTPVPRDLVTSGPLKYQACAEETYMQEDKVFILISSPSVPE